MNNTACYAIWMDRTLKRQAQVGVLEAMAVKPYVEKQDSHMLRNLFAAIVIAIAIFAVWKSQVFTHKSQVSIQPQNREKTSVARSLGNIFANFIIPQFFMNGEIKDFALGEEEAIPMSGLQYIPDGHISKIEKDGNLTLFVSAHDKSYLMFGNTFNDLNFLRDSNSLPEPILKPELEGFDKDYAGFGQVIENPNTSDLIGIYHTEVRLNPDASDSQLTSIALAISKDKGFTWQKIGQIITGQNTLSPGTNVSGAGQPSGIVVGDYIYLYFSDWNRLMPDSIHLARAPLDSNGMSGTWEKYTESGFVNVGLNGKSIPVITIFSWDKTIFYTANPSISYNTYLKKYLAIFETNIGFFAAISADGIHWGSYRLIFEFPSDTTMPKNIGDVWYSYPSLLSFDTPSDMVTAKTGYLYYSKGIFDQDHQLIRREFTIK